LAFRRPAFTLSTDQTSLQFRNGTKYGEDHLSGRHTGIELLRKGNEPDALGSEGFQGSKQVAH